MTAASPALREAARAELVAAFKPLTTGLDVYSSTQLGSVNLIVLEIDKFRERM